MGIGQQGVLATWRLSRCAAPGCACFLLLLAPACVQVRPEPDFEEARRLVQVSTGSSEVFDPYAPVLTDEQIGAILADGLSLEEAQRLAVLNNRELQAEFLEIGVAHADWVQSPAPCLYTWSILRSDQSTQQHLCRSWRRLSLLHSCWSPAD